MMKIENVIAGALFDLMGFLTTRDERLTLSSADDASPAVKALEQFGAARGLSLSEADVQRWSAVLVWPAGALPARPEPWITNMDYPVGHPSRNHYAEDQMDAHAHEAWTMGLDVGMEHAPVAGETTLPDLARLLGAASKDGKAVKLSAIAAGTLYNALRTPAAAQQRAVVFPPDGTVSPFTVINLGSGQVKIGDAIHDARLPALWFGKDGLGMGAEESMHRPAFTGETLAVITFANVEGLDVLAEVVQRLRRIAFPAAPAAPTAGSAT